MMRWIAGLLVVLLAACGAAEPSPSVAPSAPSSPAPEATVDALPSVPVTPSASTAAATGALRARPLGAVEAAPLGYLEYLPPGHGDGERRPLLIFLHGAGEAGDGSGESVDLVAKLGIPEMIVAGDWPAEHPFVVLAPQYGTEPAEQDCALAEDVAAFVRFATTHYELDTSRVYLTGISCGAIGIWDYLASYGDEAVAAVVPIAGHAEWALEEAGCAPLTEVPVWAFHGARDEVVPVVHIEGPMDQIRACDGAEAADMKLTVYPDADHFEDNAWTRTYDLSAGHDIYTWMLGHANAPTE